MKELTKEMIKEFNLKKLGYDFMGYEQQRGDIFTYHHLVIPKRFGGKETRNNGAILYSTPHQYLHVIEAKDFDIFAAVTSEMIDMNIKGYIDLENIKYIDDCLTSFEKEHSADRTSKGKILIKEEYIRRIKL